MGPSTVWEISAKEERESSGQGGLEFNEPLSKVLS